MCKQIPEDKPWLQFTKWAEEYGYVHDQRTTSRLPLTKSSPVYSLMLGTKTYVILSSPDAVKDLIDKRSSIYSSRPDMYMAHDVASGGLRLVTAVSRPPLTHLLPLI